MDSNDVVAVDSNDVGEVTDRPSDDDVVSVDNNEVGAVIDCPNVFMIIIY